MLRFVLKFLFLLILIESTDIFKKYLTNLSNTPLKREGLSGVKIAHFP